MAKVLEMDDGGYLSICVLNVPPEADSNADDMDNLLSGEVDLDDANL
jgi:hypothetical protein